MLDQAYPYQTFHRHSNSGSSIPGVPVVSSADPPHPGSTGAWARGGGSIGEFVYLRTQRGRDRETEEYVGTLAADNRTLKARVGGGRRSVVGALPAGFSGEG